MENLNPSFIADVHLGKLSRLMRMLGFDVLYDKDSSPHTLAQTSASENRILLSRSGSLCGSVAPSLRIISEQPDEQVKQVLHGIGLIPLIAPFTRCLVCNGKLILVPVEKILNVLPANTARYMNTFWECSHCCRHYWKGSHYNRMEKLVEELRSEQPD
ncbi:hypothetical protein EXU57_14255 [Segetibacter sp. 3557_3]|uniref:Mut7-C RNAse domain-containing protein n=1 Tax=Segetibacter sp. 3557_3 TaxID=2547429 RepID=UPI001059123A|nr:Mut7-C RNAse domain-containing protein [Segetibacter sp. 3557_3]TDH25262.1 hypothetical protein EXU57_14255 [Segetibacter sp. 3557_3]